LLERSHSNGLPSPTIPVRSIISITLFPMHIGMNPGRGLAFVRLRALLSLRPVPFRVPPEPLPSLCESFGGLAALSEFLKPSKVLPGDLYIYVGRPNIHLSMPGLTRHIEKESDTALEHGADSCYKPR